LRKADAAQRKCYSGLEGSRRMMMVKNKAVARTPAVLLLSGLVVCLSALQPSQSARAEAVVTTPESRSAKPPVSAVQRQARKVSLAPVPARPDCRWLGCQRVVVLGIAY
jgi:hypothetical protein